MSIKVIVDNHEDVYFPGQTIVGRVEVVAHQQIKTKGVTIKFTGQGHTQWATGQKYKSMHSGSEEYYAEKVYLFGNGQDTVTLNAGHHVYPIKFTLPQNIPSSYESVMGQVRHQCKAKINIPWEIDLSSVQRISVNHIYDLNKDENSMMPVKREEKKTFTLSSGSIILTLIIDRIGFVPGEKLRVYVEVENDSDKVIEVVKMNLIQKCGYSDNDGHGEKDTVTIAKMRVEGIKGRGKHVIWSNTGLIIPAVPATYLTHCNLIDIRYHLKLQMSPSGWTSKMEMEYPIIIGNIPLQHHFNLYKMITNRRDPKKWVDQPDASVDPYMMPSIWSSNYSASHGDGVSQPTAPPSLPGTVSDKSPSYDPNSKTDTTPHGDGVPQPTAPPSLPGTVSDKSPPYDPNSKTDAGNPPVFPGYEQYPEMPPPSYGASQHSVPLEDGQTSDGAPMKSFVPSYVTFNPQDSRPVTPN